MNKTALGKYQPYPEYKDSGVEWLGEIPTHWIEGRIKQVTVNLDYRRIPLSAEERGGRKGKYPYYGASGIIDSVDDFIFNEDTILIGEDGANLLSRSTPLAFIASGKYWVNNHAHILKPLDKMYSFWVCAFNNIDITPVVTGSAQPKLTAEALGNLEIAYPPSITERTKIANFLDHETAKIDTLIDKQQQLIKLLKEKRQAVISHAVTKGLNPDAPMKDSGVEWLGEVPEHWVITKAKYVARIFIPQRNKPELNDSDGHPWITMEEMKKKYILGASRFVSNDAMKDAGSKILSSGSVIASCVGNFGVTSINTLDVIINQQLQAFIPKTIKAEYLQSIVSLSKQYFELIGTAATLVYVNQEGFENLPVLLPPAHEQDDICKYVSDKDIKFTALINKAEVQVNLLQERRTALISAAVTGKIDVRYPISRPTGNAEIETTETLV